MQESEKQQFVELLSALGEVWQTELTAVVIESYWQALQEYELRAVMAAAKRILKEYKYAKFPVPAEFANRIAPDETTAKAIKAWESANAALKWWTGSGQHQEPLRYPTFKDSIIHNVVDSYFGGWSGFYQEWNETITKLSFFRREFIHAYEVMAGSKTFNPQLEEPTPIKQLMERSEER